VLLVVRLGVLVLLVVRRVALELLVGHQVALKRYILDGINYRIYHKTQD